MISNNPDLLSTVKQSYIGVKQIRENYKDLIDSHAL